MVGQGNRLIDNSPAESMADCLNSLLADSTYTELCIATGYWDLKGMKLIRTNLSAFLARGGKLCLLIGEEPTIRQGQLIRYEETNTFPDFYIKRDFANLTDEYKPIVQLLLDYCTGDENAPIQIRVYGQNLTPKQFLHAKCYIAKKPGGALGIIGSANFTGKGLSDNAELCYVETNSAIVTTTPNANNHQKGHIQWFAEKWEMGVEWNQTFIKEILHRAPLVKKIEEESAHILSTPYATYIRFLYELFGPSGSTASKDFIPQVEGFQRIQFQIDAVNRAYGIMMEHHGCIVADVVGLGKTLVALMVASKFLHTNRHLQHTRRILIVTPPAVRNAWESTIKLFDEDPAFQLAPNIDIVTTGKVVSLSPEELVEADCDDTDDDEGSLSLDSTQEYGLVIIDESHKFRNSSTLMYRALDSFLGECSSQPYMLLLSATPQNNAPQDIKNQVLLFQRQPNYTTLDSIPGRRLLTFFNDKQKEFLRARKAKNMNALTSISKEIREKVLDFLLVRRTRSDIAKHYPQDNLQFPSISGPHLLEYKLSPTLAQLFHDTIILIAPSADMRDLDNPAGLGYHRYRALEHITNPQIKKIYKTNNLSPESTSLRLAGLMRQSLIKRFESSAAAFKSSLSTLCNATQNMIDMLKDDCVFICPGINVNMELDVNKKRISSRRPRLTRQDCYNDIRTLISKKGEPNIECRAVDLSPQYLTRLEDDLVKLRSLAERWGKVTLDPKRDALLKSLEPRIFDPSINNPQQFDAPRLVIFTESIVTATDLTPHLENLGYRILAINSTNRQALDSTIRANFDANAPQQEQRDDYDIILTTEVLAEGINLHRANVVLNYDTPWNSTKLMQRIGRVNRIGSRESAVHVFNFMPVAESEAQIALVSTAHAKLQSFHVLFSGDNQVLTTAEIVPSSFDRFGAGSIPVDEPESPLESFAAELRLFQQEHSAEYQLITQQPYPILAATTSATPGLVCLVKDSHARLGLKLHITSSQAFNLSTLDMLHLLRCDYHTPALPLGQPTLADYSERALREFTSFSKRMFTSKDSSKKRTQALQACRLLQSIPGITDASKALLAQASAFIRANDSAIMARVVRLAQELDPNTRFIPLTPAELESALRNALRVLDARQAQRTALPPFLALATQHQSS